MNSLKENIGEIIIYQMNDGRANVNVTFSEGNLWLSLKQMAALFGRDKSVISRHLRKIFNEGELEEKAVVAFFATTATDGKTYQVEYFNLDVIISVGYRVNSKMGTQFRRWASGVLQDHLVKGYSVNQNITQTKIKELQTVIDLLANTLTHSKLVDNLGTGVLGIVKRYTKTWDILLRYDENRLEHPLVNDQIIELTYEEAQQAILTLQQDLFTKREASYLFGKEREQSL
jgi:DNA ligase (NAD+)